MAENKENGMVLSTNVGLNDLLPEEFNLDKIHIYMGMDVNGIEDKEGYKKIKAAHIEAKKIRTEIGKRKDAIKAPAIEFNRKVDDLTRDLKEKLEPAIAHLAEQRTTYEEEKERIKKEAEEARVKMIAERTAKLFELGFVFNGEDYILNDPAHADKPMIMKPGSIEEIEDGLFEEFCRKADRIAKIKAAEELKIQERLKKLDELEAAEKQEESADDVRKHPINPEDCYNEPKNTINLHYRKIPVVIEAFQMTKERGEDNFEWPVWLNQAWNKEPGEEGSFHESDNGPVITTKNGPVILKENDWMILGVHGELYPCNPEIFEQTYEPVE